MASIDDHQRFQDERAADLRERDRQREPARHPRRADDLLTRRRAFQARMQDQINATAARTASVRLVCPSCSGAVYAPLDSAGERIDCAACGAQLVTRQIGVEVVPFHDGGSK